MIGILPESAPFSQYQDVEALFFCRANGVVRGSKRLQYPLP
jgi:hypothetical protein